jgi:hypothetical protein
LQPESSQNLIKEDAYLSRSREIRQPFQELLNSRSDHTDSSNRPISRVHQLSHENPPGKSSFSSEHVIHSTKEDRREELKRQMAEFNNKLRGGAVISQDSSNTQN